MKQKLLFILCICFCLRGFSQEASKDFTEVKNVTIRNIGAIKKNNVIKGYFNFYEFDKVDKNTRLFKLNLMDENMNTLGTKEIEGPKEWDLVSGAFDGTNFCFKFWDPKTKSFDVKVYDQSANEVNSNVTAINYKPTGMKPTMFKQIVGQELNVIDGVGVVDYTYNDPNDAFITTLTTADAQKSWTQTYEPDGKSKVMLPTFLNGNSDMVLTAVTRVDKGLYSTKTQNSIIANSVKDGSQLFDISTEFDDDTHVVPVSATFEGDKIIVIGLNYKKAKTFTSPPDGLAFLELDKTGNVLKSNFKTFDESLGQFLPMEGDKLAEGYYLYIHDIVKTKNNTNLVIAEKFKKSGGAGAVLTGLSMLSGSNAGFISLKLENMVAMEYDKDGNVIQAEEIPKALGSTGDFPSYMGFLSVYYLAAYAKVSGDMDYMYTTKNDDNSEVTFSYVDYDKLDNADKKSQNFGTIKYKAGKFTTDKVSIKKDKATWGQILPAKANHILQVNYYKKEKKLTMELVKLN